MLHIFTCSSSFFGLNCGSESVLVVPVSAEVSDVRSQRTPVVSGTSPSSTCSSRPRPSTPVPTPHVRRFPGGPSRTRRTRRKVPCAGGATLRCTRPHGANVSRHTPSRLWREVVCVSTTSVSTSGRPPGLVPTEGISTGRGATGGR